MRILFVFILILVKANLLFGQQVKYVPFLKDQQQFLDLEGKPLTDKYRGTKAVKVVMDLHTQKLYFISTEHYKYHRDFCQEVLHNNDELSRFNYINYRAGFAREFVFGTINYYPKQKIYTLEFSDIEQYSPDIILLYKIVKAKSFIGESLLVHPVTQRQLNFLKDYKKTKVKTISSNALYRGIEEQLLVKGNAIGILRKIEIDALNKTKINPWDIILTNGSPNDIDLCAGLILTKFQSPLSHIIILSHNRGTPVLARKTAYVDEALNEFVGKAVRIQVDDDFTIEAIDPKYLNKVIKRKNTRRRKNLKVDTRYDFLTSIRDISYKDLAKFGGKTSNLGELYKVRGLKRYCSLPKGAMGIPMYYYIQHIQSSGANGLIAKALRDSIGGEDLALLLKQIRKKIRAHPVDENFLFSLKERLIALGHKNGDRLRFRSSTNAEDIKGFNGAGLYTSCTGILGDSSSKTIERALKKVWASCWNETAFRERSYFNINQRNVAMGILVHTAFGTEEVNGVAITKNLYRKDDFAYTINAQKGEVAIVAGDDSSTSEHSLLGKSAFDETVSNEYISFSSLNKEHPLMTIDLQQRLFDALRRIKEHFYFRVREDDTKFTSYALDIEFKIKNGQVIIKQVRPFN